MNKIQTIKINYSPASKSHIKVHYDISQNKYKVYIISGGKGSSKTYPMFYEVLKHCLKEKDITFLIMRKTYLEIYGILYLDFIKFLQPYSILFNIENTIDKGKKIYFPATNSTVIFRNADDYSKLQGLNLNYAWLDEGTQIHQTIFDEIFFGRLRVGEFPKLFITTESATQSHYLYKFYLSREDCQLYKLKTENNRYISKSFLVEILRLKKENYRLYLKKYCGEWLNIEHSIFYNIKTYEAKFHRPFILKDISVLEWLVGLDWSYQGKDWTTLLLAIFTKDEQYTIIEEKAFRNFQRTEIPNMVNDQLFAWINQYKIQNDYLTIYPDYSHEYFNDQLSKNFQIEKVDKRKKINNYEVFNLMNSGMITYLSSLEELEFSIMNYQFKKDRFGNVTDNILHNEATHYADGLRYLFYTHYQLYKHRKQIEEELLFLKKLNK